MRGQGLNQFSRQADGWLAGLEDNATPWPVLQSMTCQIFNWAEIVREAKRGIHFLFHFVIENMRL